MSAMRSTRVREFGKSVAYRVFDLAHLEHLATRRGVAHIMNLHRVHPEPSPYWPPIHPDDLDWLIGRLKRLGTFVDLREVVAAPVIDRARIFALSFDDGYADYLEFALPVLEAHGVPSNLNVIADSVLSGEPIWSARLYEALAGIEGDRVSIVNDLMPKMSMGRITGSPEHMGFGISNHLRRLPLAERISAVEAIEEFSKQSKRSVRALTTDEVKALPPSVHVGAHGGTHEPMTGASIDEFLDDFALCRDLFQNHLCLPLTTYAFPLGGYRQDQVDALLREGVSQVLIVDELTTRGGIPLLPRLTVGGTAKGQYLAKSVGAAARLGRR